MITPLDSPAEVVHQPEQKRSPRVAMFSGLRDARFWLLPVLMLGVVAVVAISLGSAPADLRQVVSAVGQMAAMLAAAIASFWVGVRSPRGRARWAWLCIGAGLVSYVLAEAVVGYITTLTPQIPRVTVADAFFLLFYPLMAAGVILLPSAASSDAERVGVFLDAGITAAAVLSLSLAFLIAPLYFSSAPNPLDVYVFIAYPVGDFVLILALIIQAVRGVEQTYRPVLFWLTIGMLCLIYADSAFNYLTLQKTYVVGAPGVDTFYVAGGLALSLAPLYLLIQGDEPGTAWRWLDRFAGQTTSIRPTGTLRQVILPYIPLAVLFILLWRDQPSVNGATPYPALEVLALVVVLMIVARQALTVRDLINARIATARAQQLDALKDQFITNINHELRTPMMTMQGYIELLDELQEGVDSRKRADMLDRARRANTALVQLLQSILDTRRIDQETADFEPEAINVQAAVSAAMELIDPREGSLAERVLHMHVPVDLTLWGEPVRVQQILTNLLSNAVKYSASGTSITIAAGLVADRRAGRFRRGGRNHQQEQMVEITVQDQGFGIPPGQIPLLFRRFVRLPRDLASRVRGTGLGLYLCRVFATTMGGTIWVESTGVPGQGSTFHLLLPIPPKSAQSTLNTPVAHTSIRE